MNNSLQASVRHLVMCSLPSVFRPGRVILILYCLFFQGRPVVDGRRGLEGFFSLFLFGN